MNTSTLDKAAKEYAEIQQMKGIRFVNCVLDFKAGVEWQLLQQPESVLPSFPRANESFGNYVKRAIEQPELIDNGWISVEDKPEKAKPILLFNGFWTGVGYYDKNYLLNMDDEPKWSDEIGEYISPEPTHWQPLPAPPKTKPI